MATKRKKLTAVERNRRRYEREQREADVYARMNAGPLTVYHAPAVTPPAPTPRRK